MFKTVAFAAFCAAVGINCLMAAYEDWLNGTARHFQIRDVAMGVAGVGAAIAGLVA